VPRKIGWLKNVDGVYLVNYSSLPIGRQCLKAFSCHWHSLIGWKDLQIKRQLHGEIINTMVSSLIDNKASKPAFKHYTVKLHL
jgi:hypothetical protein